MVSSGYDTMTPSAQRPGGAVEQPHSEAQPFRRVTARGVSVPVLCAAGSDGRDRRGLADSDHDGMIAFPIDAHRIPVNNHTIQTDPVMIGASFGIA